MPERQRGWSEYLRELFTKKYKSIHSKYDKQTSNRTYIFRLMSKSKSRSWGLWSDYEVWRTSKGFFPRI